MLPSEEPEEAIDYYEEAAEEYVIVFSKLFFFYNRVFLLIDIRA